MNIRCVSRWPIPKRPLADLAWYFASILSAEYADAMLKPARQSAWIWTRLVPDLSNSRNIKRFPNSFHRVPGILAGKAHIDRLILVSRRTPRCATPSWKNECQVMPFPNPADLPRMKENNAINLMSKAGLNTGFLAFNTQKRRWTTLRCVRPWRWRSINRRSLKRCSTVPVRRRKTCCRRALERG